MLNFDEIDLDELSDFPDADFETMEIELVDSATAAQTIAELDAELATLRQLEQQAAVCYRAGDDRKWEELAGLMQDPLMYTAEGRRRKLVIFSEHRDTLDYLHARITTLLGLPEAVVTIHGGIGRSQRLDIQDRFRNDPAVHVLIATDAAGEGINSASQSDGQLRPALES
ncbi:MAG: helicase-related protein [Caldilineaceae bacterium]